MSDKNFIDAFLAQPYLCRIALTRESQAPLIRPLWFLWENARLLLSTRDDTIHTNALKRNPLVALCIDKPTTPYAGIICEGEAELVESLGKDHELLRRLAARYLPAERVDGFMQRPMAQVENRVRFVITPHSWTVWNNDPEAPIAPRRADYA